MDPNGPTQSPTKPGVDKRIVFALILAPALLTILVGYFHQENATMNVVWGGSLVAGIASGVLITQAMRQPLWVRFLLGLVIAFALFCVCFILCFLGCSLVGGGGVRF